MSAVVQAADPAGFDTAAAAAFEERLVDALNGGALAVMISIGHRTGLFDVLETMEPATPAAIAERAGLNQRYVREWLGAMTTGRVVEHDAASGTYRLPAEHAACLTRAATPNNIALYAQYIPVMGSVEDGIIECFRGGGGLGYECFPRFHEVMAEDSGQTILPALQSHILKLVPGLQDRLRDGIRALDAGCGRGKAVNLLARLYPNSRFTGYDLSADAIAFATDEAAELGHGNARFVARDLSTFDTDAEEGSYDLITTFDAVHDQGQPLALLRGIRRALAPGGVYIAQDINAASDHAGNLDHPFGPLLYAVSCTHCMTVSLAQGGEGLGTMWGRQQAESMLREAGFASVEIHELAHDPMNCYYVCR